MSEYKPVRRGQRYTPPSDDDAMELLNDVEFRLCGDNPRSAVARGRAKAWAEHRANGPVGRMRSLCDREVGEYVILEGYTRSSQVSALAASVSIDEGMHLRCSLERSLVDGSVIGVRVTLAGFTR